MHRVTDENSTEAVIGSKKIGSLDETGSVRAHVEVAFKTDTNDLVLIGWLFDYKNQVQGLSVLRPKRDGFAKKSSYLERPLKHGLLNVQQLRTLRPDVTQAFLSCGQSPDDCHGLVLVVPDFPLDGKLALAFHDGRFATLPIAVMTDVDRIESAVKKSWNHSGTALISSMRAAIGENNSLTQMVAELDCESLNAVPVAIIDQTLLLNNRVLILYGWTKKRDYELLKVELLSGNDVIDITSQLKRYSRSDLFEAYPWSEADALGFIFVLEVPANLSLGIKVKISYLNGRQVVKPQVEAVGWSQLSHFINGHDDLAETLFNLLTDVSVSNVDKKKYRENIACLQNSSFLARYTRMPSMVKHPETIVASIDQAYPLGDAGVLIFGWQLNPKRKPLSVTVHDDEGNSVEISEQMFSLLRKDVANTYRSQFPQINDRCGFVCFVPMSTRSGDLRGLRFDFGELGSVWLKVPTPRPKAFGVELIKELLNLIPAPDRMRHDLYNLFNAGLGHAIEVVSQSRPPFAGKIEQRQFGTPNEVKLISVVVPLYGRFDFLRHQLAHFVDDKDFETVDLIYVVDDPSILNATLDLASKYHPLFEVPFRVVWYGENRGFAGANNIGASVARGDYLVLMNSDVIPQKIGWLATLRNSLDTLPDAGAVGPLLQFCDGSIQHAGMSSRRDLLLPGFLLNTHKQMGMVWSGEDVASEQTMLTAACLMLRTSDYLALGGFDEGYIIGDFEDSDLCLSLSKQGFRLWMEPNAKLWHLERQSQDHNNIVGQRQMLTLYNGWRYSEKIRTGVIADPTQGEV